MSHSAHPARAVRAIEVGPPSLLSHLDRCRALCPGRLRIYWKSALYRNRYFMQHPQSLVHPRKSSISSSRFSFSSSSYCLHSRSLCRGYARTEGECRNAVSCHAVPIRHKTLHALGWWCSRQSCTYSLTPQTTHVLHGGHSTSTDRRSCR